MNDEMAFALFANERMGNLDTHESTVWACAQWLCSSNYDFAEFKEAVAEGFIPTFDGERLSNSDVSRIMRYVEGVKVGL